MRFKTVTLFYVASCISAVAVHAQVPPGESGQAASIGKPSMFTVEFFNEPPRFSEEQLAALDRILSRVNLPPPSGSQTSPVAGPTVPETTPSPLPVTPSLNESNVVGVALPLKISIAESASYLFYAANAVAARSKVDASGSENWLYINPSADMPDFCCEQAAIADRSRDILLWYRQGMYNPAMSQNRFVLAISKDGGKNFCTYSFRPVDVDRGFTERFWESPELAITRQHLFVSVNLHTNSGAFDRKVLLRLPLESLSSCSGFNFRYIQNPTASATADFLY